MIRLVSGTCRGSPRKRSDYVALADGTSASSGNEPRSSVKHDRVSEAIKRGGGQWKGSRKSSREQESKDVL